MKNTFAVSMTLLVALTLGGSFAAYRIGTTPHHAKDSHSTEAKGGTASTVPSEEAPSPTSSATGAAGSPEAQGDAKADNEGGEQAGQNGAVAASTGAAEGSQEGGQTENRSATVATTEGAQVGENTTANAGNETGRPPAETAATGGTVTSDAGDATAGQAKYALSCAACHGPDGGGGIGVALNTSDGPKSWTLEQFTAALREGKTPQKTLAATMPRFSPEQLSDSDIANIYAFIKTLN